MLKRVSLLFVLIMMLSVPAFAQGGNCNGGGSGSNVCVGTGIGSGNQRSTVACPYGICTVNNCSRYGVHTHAGRRYVSRTYYNRYYR